MLVDSPTSAISLAALSGAATHTFIFRHGEWDLHSPRILLFYLMLLAVSFAIEKNDVFSAWEVSVPSNLAIEMVGCHILGLYSNILVYRGFFHQLSRFPGPFVARFSNLYKMLLCIKKFHLYEETAHLHSQYGDYVRVGPNQLSVTDPEAIQILHGPKAKVTKGIWYSNMEPRISLFNTRNKKEHAQRRKVWDQGFSSRALRDYEPRVYRYKEQLIDAIEQRIGTPMDATKWFNYYSFDIMGDLSFGKSFNMLVDGQDASILTKLHADVTGLTVLGQVPWILPFFKRIPLLNADYLKHWNWISSRVEERMKNIPDRPDVFSWILKAFEKGPQTAKHRMDLDGDTYLVIVAGSDTTAAALSCLFFHLADNPSVYKTLQAELDALPSLSHEQLLNVKLLDAVINEALRLHPAVPSGLQRVAPPEGLKIGDNYIPGNTTIWMPMHSVFRDERSFERPNEFVPERWTTKPELIKNSSAFFPFSLGPYSCVGKQLALMEIRCITAEILTRYDMSFAPGQTTSAYLDGIRDTFTTVAAPLQVVFQKRGKDLEV
ncbi:cytochrome P450 monooxygenase [Aspergillus avenaceus]|uniref:Cytochrome P450 monooxygenase n=1 Tax=Aspergillus avenaceus TaxID=36643 RepID=A0A5N6U2L7_ASPAV|nr:cytochrome P450 monooxygenase [Aspergillus avenaceus]